MPDLYERKLRVWEIFRLSCRSYARSFKIMLLFVFAATFLMYRINAALVNNFRDALQAIPVWLRYAINPPTVLVDFYIAISSIAVIRTAAAIIEENRNPSIFEVWGFIRKRGLAVAGIYLLEQLLVLFFRVPSLIQMFFQPIYQMPKWCLGTIALILLIAGVIVLVLFMFTYQLAVLEEESVFSSFLHSCRLVRERWWRSFGVVVALSLPAILVMFFLNRVYIPSKIWSHVMLSVRALVMAYVDVGVTIYFLNIIKLKQEKTMSHVDPVIPSKNDSYETIS